MNILEIFEIIIFYKEILLPLIELVVEEIIKSTFNVLDKGEEHEG